MLLSGQQRLEYENQLKSLERSLNAEQIRRQQYCFFNKQLSAQIKKLQVENKSLQKQLNAVKKCSSCECLDVRRKQSSSSETGMQNSTPRSHIGSVDATSEKVRETRELGEKIEERDRQINSLQQELESLKRKDSSDLQERKQLVERIRNLEEQLRNTERRSSAEDIRIGHERCFPNSGCNSCKRRFRSWENLARINDAELVCTTPLPVSQQSETSRNQLIELNNRLKKQEEAFNSERIRMIEKESALINEKQQVMLECENWKQRYQALEIELTKRRNDDSQNRLQFEQYNVLECERKLLAQAKLLKQLDNDMKCALKEKAKFSKRCAELEVVIAKKNEENDSLSAMINQLQERVRTTESSHSEALRVHNEQIKNYQELLKEKDGERDLLVEELCAESPSAFADICSDVENDKPLDDENLPYELIGKDFDAVKKAFIKLTKERKKLQKEVEALTEELKAVKATVGELNKDLASRTEDRNRIAEELSNANANIAELKKRIATSEAAVERLQNDVLVFQKNCDQLREELSQEKKSSTSLRTAISSYEELINSKSCELTNLSYKLQCAQDNIYKLRTKNFELEANLTLNSRELRGARTKLERLKSKVKELERESRDSPLRTASLPSPSTKATGLSPVLASTPTNTNC